MGMYEVLHSGPRSGTVKATYDCGHVSFKHYSVYELAKAQAPTLDLTKCDACRGATINGKIYLTAFTDASYCNRSRASGWAYWLKFNRIEPNVVKRAEAVSGITSSDNAEKLAIAKLIEYIEENLDITGVHVIIQSDCQSAIDFFRSTEYLKNKKPASIEFRWVKGHQGVKSPRHAVNTWCDREAKSKMRELRDSILGYPKQINNHAELS